jgi:hypothetical protein
VDVPSKGASREKMARTPAWRLRLAFLQNVWLALAERQAPRNLKALTKLQ